VLQLQTKVDRLRAHNPTDGRDAVRQCYCHFSGFEDSYGVWDEHAKRERDRAKWNTLNDEIAKLKTKV
jgi:diaphanous 1